MRMGTTLQTFGRVLHAVSLYALGLAAVGMVGITLGSLLGLWPWLELDARWGAIELAAFGMWAQIGLTLFLVLITAFFPSSLRVLTLEKSHRDFRIGMRDVAEAYHAAHMADRQGVFTLSGEFDAVRERLEWLRDHPDLKLLEADVLTVAAQMSQQSHRLAQIYSEERVQRARDFLAQRQKEAEEQQKRIQEALATMREIMRWNSQVELEEATVASQLQQLDEQLHEILPALGYSFEGDGPTREPAAATPAVEPSAAAEEPAFRHGPSVRRPDNVLPMAVKPAAE
ncbi:DNA repair protein [Rubellimicrobium sp. CFH 75288]|uniref:DNA repair protein n=1 Tax=Rubellimicrobium sp. CFH 75288 TaxID=2697034 RepID=UPI001AA159EC|nr:DNA repair protein [Rubellimicrobium sp. CFH 75288]